MDDSVLQQSLTQVNPFLWIIRLTNLHQPGHKLTEDTENTGIATHWSTHRQHSSDAWTILWEIMDNDCEQGREL